MRRPNSVKPSEIQRPHRAPQPALELPLARPQVEEMIEEELHRRPEKQKPKDERGVAIVDFYI